MLLIFLRNGLCDREFQFLEHLLRIPFVQPLKGEWRVVAGILWIRQMSLGIELG